MGFRLGSPQINDVVPLDKFSKMIEKIEFGTAVVIEIGTSVVVVGSVVQIKINTF